MKPFLYELKKVFASRTVIVLIVVLILVSLGVSYGLKSELASENPSPSATAYPNWAIYYSNDSYFMVFNFFNGYGLPASGVDVNVAFPGNNITSEKVADNMGYANFTFPGLNGNVSTTVSVTFKYPPQYVGEHVTGFTGTLNSSLVNSGDVGRIDIAPVVNPSNPTQLELHLFYIGMNDTKSPKYYVYYAGTNNTSLSYSLNGIREGNMTAFGTVGNFYTTNLNLNLPASSNYTNYYVAFTREPPDSNQTAYNASFYGQLTKPLTSSARNNLFFSEISGSFNIFVPLMAVLVGYLAYGRERSSGVIESVIVRPITKAGVTESRFLATMISILASTLISVAALDIFIYYYFGAFLNSITVLQAVWGLFVEASAFVGIIYLISHLIKSSGAIIGAGITLYVLLVLLWSIFMLLFTSIGAVPYGSHTYLQREVILDFANPGGYLSLIENFSVGLQGSPSASLQPYGVTPLTVAIGGILWIVVPITIAIILAKIRD